MNENTTTDLQRREAQLEVRMQAANKDAKRAIGYVPRRYNAMLKDLGALGTAHALLASPGISDGFTTLMLAQLPELTLESLILEPEFVDLFTPDEQRVARERLGRL